MFDVMHVSIILIAGANFWPWIILNVIIVVVVKNPRFSTSANYVTHYSDRFYPNGAVFRESYDASMV